jgi:hypothetical protein
MDKAELVNIEGQWYLKLPVEAAFVLGAKSGALVSIDVIGGAFNARPDEPVNEFVKAAAKVASENRGTLSKLAKR